jgi:hypothetical protein
MAVATGFSRPLDLARGWSRLAEHLSFCEKDLDLLRNQSYSKEKKSLPHRPQVELRRPR